MMNAPARATMVSIPDPSFEIVPERAHDHEDHAGHVSAPAARILREYDRLLEEIYRVRQELKHMADVLKAPAVVRYRPDAPPGYGLVHDMSNARIPDMQQLGDVVHEWQLVRGEMVELMLDPETDERTSRHLDKKLHPRTIACC